MPRSRIPEMLREIEAIANNPAAPTFENTIAALETTGLGAFKASRISKL